MFLSAYLTANLLGARDNGTWSLIQSTFLFLGGVITFGLPLSITKFIAEWRDKDPDIASKILHFSHSIVRWGACLWGIVFLLGKDFWWPGITLPLWMMLVILAIAYFSVEIVITQAAFTGSELYKSLVLTNFIQGLTLLAFQVLGAYWGGVYGMIIGLCIAQACGYLQLLRLEPKHIKERLTREQISAIIRLAFPSMGIILSSLGIILVLNRHMSNLSPAALGAWHAFSKVLNIVLVTMGMLLSPLMPIMSNMPLSGKQLRPIMQALHLGILILGVLPVWFAAKLAPYWLHFMFADSYNPFVYLFIIAGMYTAVCTINLPMTFLSYSKGLLIPTLSTYIIGVITLIVGPKLITGTMEGICYFNITVVCLSSLMTGLVAWSKGILPSNSYLFSTTLATLALFLLPSWLGALVVACLSLYWVHYSVITLPSYRKVKEQAYKAKQKLQSIF